MSQANQIIQFEVVQARTARGTVTITPAYSGGLMRVNDGRHVIIDLAGLQINASTPLLLEHDETNEVGSGTAVVVAGQLNATGKLYEANNPDVAGKNGASVGVTIIEAEALEAGTHVEVNGQSFKPTVPFLLVSRSVLNEVSLLKEPADESTKVLVAAKSKSNSLEDSNMSKQTQQQNNDQPDAGTVETVQWQLEQDDTEKVLEILASAEAESLTADDLAELKDDLKAGKLNASTAAKRVKLASRLAELDRKSGGGSPAYSNGSGIKNTDILAAALLVKGGNGKLAEKCYGDRILASAQPLARMTLAELDAASLRMEGKQVPHDHRQILASTGFSTMSLPVALSDAMHKTVLDLLGQAQPTWQTVAAEKQAVDFHDQHELRQTDIGELEEVPPDGEVKHGLLSEDTFKWSVDTFAKIYHITRRDLIQDSANFFAAIPRLFARMVQRKTSDLFWGLILSNPNNHFSVGNGNQITEVLGISGLEAAITAMRKQQDRDGRDLDIQPYSLVVPPELEVQAMALLESIELNREQDREPTGNPLAGKLELEVEPRLSNTGRFGNASATAWYLFAKPAESPAFVGFGPSGQSGMFTYFGPDTDMDKLSGGAWRSVLDVGVAMGEPKAGVQSTGAGG